MGAGAGVGFLLERGVLWWWVEGTARGWGLLQRFLWEEASGLLGGLKMAWPVWVGDGMGWLLI